jgi:beta-glucosidase
MIDLQMRRALRRAAVLVACFASLALLASAQGTLGTPAPPSNAQLASPAIEKRVNDLLGKMTLEEKLGQLVQYSDSGYQGAGDATQVSARRSRKKPAPYSTALRRRYHSRLSHDLS